MKVNKNFIGGKWVPSMEKETYLQRNPADLEKITGMWPKSGIRDVEEAIASATLLASDGFISYATWRWSDLHKTHISAPTYRYLYDHPRPGQRH